jgi:tetratricopeptide (TPR) repeat protein
MIILLILNIQPLISATITILIVMTGYIIISIIRSKKRLSLLEDDCDPEAFLERTEKQRAITGTNKKINAYFDIDRSAGLITLGRFEEAKDILLSIDKNILSRKNDTLLVYTINLMSCLYELGEVASAEELFEIQIPSLAPINNRILLATNLLVAERFFYLKRYDESREQLNKVLNQKLSKRTRMEILYCLAQMDEEEGNEEAAMVKYSQVASEGNKLWIAKKARERCRKQD